MSISRQERVAGQMERIEVVFDAHRGGVTRSQLAEEADIEEKSIHSLMARLRAAALDIEHIPAVLKIGGIWIYGWAESLRQHNQEHYKRLKNERRSLRLSVTMLEQSVREHPESPELKDQLRAKRHSVEDVEAQMERLMGVLTLFRHEQEAA